jgi:hypothetical protein
MHALKAIDPGSACGVEQTHKLLLDDGPAERLRKPEGGELQDRKSCLSRRTVMALRGNKPQMVPESQPVRHVENLEVG